MMKITLWLGVPTPRGTVLKDHSIGKVGNQCPKPTGVLRNLVMVPLVKCLLDKYDSLSLTLRTHVKNLGVVTNVLGRFSLSLPS